MANFGKKSNAKLNTCHIDLQKIWRLTLQRCAIDISIIEGHRPKEIQFDYFKRGRELKNNKWIIVDKDAVITKVDGYEKVGKHNLIPSEAVDFQAYHSDKATRLKIGYDLKHLVYIAATAICVAQELFNKGEITHLLRSGANWDKDGVIIIDQTFDDLPHVELYKP